MTNAGANFDMMEVALHVVRLATSTLLAARGMPEADYNWDVAVVNLRDEGGRLRRRIGCVHVGNVLCVPAS